jgi:ABC-type Fe3+/spermidine/putrescine transport system ATPase subunit
LAPDVLLLDEPLAALDPALRKQMRSELKQLQRRTGVSFLFVTHDQEEALELSDFIAVMRDGRIEQVGSPREVYLRPRTPFVANFVGAMNWIDGAGVRPEAIRVIRGPAPSGARAVAARITSSAFLGNLLRLEMSLDAGGRVTAEIPRLDGGFEPGENVTLWWTPEDELRFPAITP